jgi:hypothetical protein
VLDPETTIPRLAPPTTGEFLDNAGKTAGEPMLRGVTAALELAHRFGPPSRL